MNTRPDIPVPEAMRSRYQFLGELARGGMGQAFRAKLGNQAVVVKFPLSGKDNYDVLTERFEREIAATAKLAHPHIVPVVDHGTEEGRPYLVTRYMPGGSLAGRRPRKADGSYGQAKPETLHNWLPGVASALDYAHARGVLHRDVKPANVFFDAHGRAYLGDFGLAKSFDDPADRGDTVALTAEHSAVGTLPYMPPERFQARSHGNGKGDQYALAVSAYELLAGRRPFVGDHAHLAIEHATLEPPPLELFRRDLPLSLTSAVLRGLSKDPAKRYPTCTDFARAVLQDVPELPASADNAILICPHCRKLLQLPVKAAGKPCTCKACGKRLYVAHDLTTLWLDGELAAPDQPEASATVADGFVASPSKDILALEKIGVSLPEGVPLSSTQKRWSILIIAFVLTAGGSTLAFKYFNSTAARLEKQKDSSSTVIASDHELLPKKPPITEEAQLPPRDPQNAPPPTATSSKPTDNSKNPPATPPVSSDISNPVPSSPESQVQTNFVVQDSALPVPETPAIPLFRRIEWCRISSTEVLADRATGLGRVPYEYSLSKYEVTVATFCEFLNNSSTGRLGLHNVAKATWDPLRSNQSIKRIRLPDGTNIYEPATGMADKPIAKLTWLDAARFCNWLHNGAHSDSDTESGCYNLNTAEDRYTFIQSPNASFWIPSLNEWFKAAFLNPDKGLYTDYATGTDDRPRPVEADETGVGIAQPGEISANYFNRCTWRGNDEEGNPTTVGSNGPANSFGLYDTAGNVAELCVDTVNEKVYLCGGDATTSSANELMRMRVVQKTSVTDMLGGLRLAGTPDHSKAEQQPSAKEIDLAGLNAIQRTMDAVILETREFFMDNRVLGLVNRIEITQIQLKVNKAIQDYRQISPQIPAKNLQQKATALIEIHEAIGRVLELVNARPALGNPLDNRGALDEALRRALGQATGPRALNRDQVNYELYSARILKASRTKN